jgi:hypothetical protein
MTRGEQLAAQRRAYALLGRLLERGEREGLPVIDWAIASHGLLTGYCYDEAYAQRPATFAVWVAALDLGVWPTVRRPDGGRQLQAVREDLDGVDVTLVAPLPEETR